MRWPLPLSIKFARAVLAKAAESGRVVLIMDLIMDRTRPRRVSAIRC
jgi:hypothetical protein